MKTQRLFWLTAIVLLALIALSAPRADAAPKASCTVTSNADSGAGTLREKLADSNCDPIVFGSAMTVTLSSTELTINRNVTIDGTGHAVTISGGNFVGVFLVNNGFTFNLQNLTVANGNAGDGGGIANFGTMNVFNVTFHSNTANAGSAISSSGTLNVTNSTFAGNTTNFTGGGALDAWGGSATIRNSIFTNNISTGCGVPANGANNNAAGTSCAGINADENCNTSSAFPINGGNNVDDGMSCGFGSTNGSQSSTNPQLGALTNGVFPLNSNSPAIDGVTYNAPNSCPATDQRGQTRDDLACDIGAYERKMSDGNTVTLAPSSSLLRTYGPARAGMQYTGANPGSTLISKVTNWSGGTPATALGAWWEITPVTGTGLNLTLKLCYSTSELGGLTESNLRFWRFSGGTWNQVGGAPTLSGASPNRCAQISGVTDLSRWTLATGNPGNAPTAVTLSSFNANAPSFDLVTWFKQMLGLAR